MSITSFADCPKDPTTQCPALGSSLAEATKPSCGWQVQYTSPYDPLTQYVLLGQPVGPGPQVDWRKGISTCAYASSLDQNAPAGFLVHAVSDTTSTH
jgi:hypothetical protein